MASRHRRRRRWAVAVVIWLPRLVFPLPGRRFDGDGMAHAVRIKAGSASYCNRWVQTARLRQEERAGWAVGTKSERGYEGMQGPGGCTASRMLPCRPRSSAGAPLPASSRLQHPLPKR